MEKSHGLIEFLCVSCGFQGLGYSHEARADHCPKCRGKMINSDHKQEGEEAIL